MSESPIPRPPPRPRYTLLLEARPSPVPAPVRLRRGLKVLLRAFALDCIDCHEVPLELPRTDTPDCPG